MRSSGHRTGSSSCASRYASAISSTSTSDWLRDAVHSASMRALNQALIRFESCLAGFRTASVSYCGGMLHADRARLQPVVAMYRTLPFSADAQDGDNLSGEASMVVCALSAAGVSNAMFDAMVAGNKTASLMSSCRLRCPTTMPSLEMASTAGWRRRPRVVKSWLQSPMHSICVRTCAGCTIKNRV